MHRPAKQIHLAAHFPGVNNTTVWSDPRRAARSTSRRSCTWPGRPSGASSTSSSSPRACGCASTAARSTTSTWSADPIRSRCSPRWPRVTDRLGLAATLNATFNEPYELARQFATLDHLSGGPGGLERGDVPRRLHRGELPPRRLPRPGRPLRPRRRVRRRRPQLWDSWADDAVVADAERGVFVPAEADRPVRAPRPAVRHPGPVRRAPPAAGPSRRRSRRATPTAAASSRAAAADVIFTTARAVCDDGQAFYADVKGRLATYGRRPRT